MYTRRCTIIYYCGAIKKKLNKNDASVIRACAYTPYYSIIIVFRVIGGKRDQ